MKLRMTKKLKFWVDVACEQRKPRTSPKGKHALVSEVLHEFEQAGDAMRYLRADGTIGWKEFAPYNGIIVTAGAPDIPQPLLDQLHDGGVLVIPIGTEDIQDLHIIKSVNGKFETRVASGFKFVPLIGKKGWQ